MDDFERRRQIRKKQAKRRKAMEKRRNTLIAIIALCAVVVIAAAAGIFKERSGGANDRSTSAGNATEMTDSGTVSGSAESTATETENESESESESENESETETETEPESESESEAADESASESDGADMAAETDQTPDNTAVVSTSTTISNMDKDTLKQSVTSLVRRYRAALASGDTDTLAQLFEVESLQNPTTYTGLAQIITGYQNTECVIVDGMDDSSKIVFIYDDLTLSDIDATVPNVTAICVREDASGNLYIDPGTYDEDEFSYKYDDELQTYIDNLKGSGDAASLVRKANEKFEEACSSNASLKQLIGEMISASQQ